MRTRVQKWGNSLALRIPKSLASEAGLEKDTPVDVLLSHGNIVVKPAPRAKPTLEELVARITPENRHSEIDFGPAVGREVW